MTPHYVKTEAVNESNSAARYAVIASASVSRQYAVFTSVIVVSGANLVSPPTTTFAKNISGLLCSQEWERFCAFFCMVFKHKELGAQVNEDSISFTTRMKPKDSGLFSDSL